jgi:hypothetical protein
LLKQTEPQTAEERQAFHDELFYAAKERLERTRRTQAGKQAASAKPAKKTKLVRRKYAEY